MAVRRFTSAGYQPLGTPYTLGAGGDIEGPTSSADNSIPRFDGTTGKKIQGSGIIVDDNNDITFPDGTDIAVNTATGTKIGTATNQKLGFFNATPIIQPTATTDLGTALSNLGLRAAGTAYPLSTTGAVQLSGPVRTVQTARTGAVTLTVASSVWFNTVDATTAAFTVTLAATTTAGYRFFLIKTDASANAVTIAGTINGVTNYTLSTQYQFVEVISTTVSGSWLVINKS